MPKRAGTEKWGDVKTRLEQLPPRDVLTLVGELYRVSAENRRFLHARVLGGAVELERYRELVSDAVNPPSFNGPIRVGEAQRLIREYQRATSDSAGTNDLTLSFIEAGTEIAANLGYGDEPFFVSLERAILSIAGGLRALDPAQRDRSMIRLRQIARRAQNIGWGYADFLRDIVNDLPE